MRIVRALASLLCLASLAHAAPTGGGFAVGDIWMNALQMPGTPFGGLVRVEPLTGTPHLVLPWTNSNAVSDQADAFCYDPVRDRILVLGSLNGQSFPTIWSVDAAGHAESAGVTIGAMVSLAPAPDGKVYVALAISNFSPLGVIGWLDAAGGHHPLKDANGFVFSPFAQPVTVFNASLIYDASSHALIYAVSHSGIYCKASGGDGKGAIWRIPLSPDGQSALSTTCEFYDVNGPAGGGTGGGIPRGFSRGPDGAFLLAFHSEGATGSLDEVAPRMQLVSPLLSVSTFASNGPYSQCGWTTAGVYSNVRHQAVIFDGANNKLRSYDLGEAGGAGDVLADGLVGGSFVQERAGLIEIAPHATAEGSLVGTPAQISIATGGSQALDIDFGAGLAGKIYLVIGSASGFTPGMTLKGHAVPLNLDAYTQLTLQSPNGFLISNSYGVLDTAGKAQAQFNLPPGAPPSIAGLVLHHAAIAAQGGSTILGVSNAAPVTLVP